MTLCACVTSASDDAVRSSDAAIQIVERVCDRKLTRGNHWKALLQQGRWHVWIEAFYDYNHGEEIFDALVNAKDGTVKCGPLVT
jgi:hypothetical protein